MDTRRAASWLAWPALAAGCVALTWLGLRRDWDGALIVAIVYLALAAALAVLERVLPHEPRWNHGDGELAHDLVFTLLGSGAGGAIAEAAVIAVWTGAASRLAAIAGRAPWPLHWPIVAQVAFTLVVADFGAYWAHRLCHEIPVLWRFHSIHHNVRRLSWLNTGRIHPIDASITLALSMPILILLGAPAQMMVWLASATTFIGLLSHCNVAMACGPLDRIFNTPGVHRWHHSRDRGEADSNYGENTMLWDLAFSTFLLPAVRPPADVGTQTGVPASIAGQMLAPFVRGPWFQPGLGHAGTLRPD